MEIIDDPLGSPLFVIYRTRLEEYVLSSNESEEHDLSANNSARVLKLSS